MVNLYVFFDGTDLLRVGNKIQLINGRTYHFSARSPVFVIAEFLSGSSERETNFRFSFRRVNYNYEPYPDDGRTSFWDIPDGGDESSTKLFPLTLVILIFNGLLIFAIFAFLYICVFRRKKPRR